MRNDCLICGGSGWVCDEHSAHPWPHGECEAGKRCVCNSSGELSESHIPIQGWEADAEQLRFIKRAQAMGFTLEEVQSLLKLRAQRSCRATRDFAVTKLRVLDANIRNLQLLREELAQLVSACDANAEESCCPVIERLAH